MKTLNLEEGFHGVGSMLTLLEEGQITNVQFLMHSESEVRKEYEAYCRQTDQNTNNEEVATKYIQPWMDAWKKKNMR